MKIRSLDVGLDAITRWHVDDEVHLPRERGVSPTFLPIDRPLDAILRRPSLDERLPALMQPENIDPDLLHPPVLTKLRRDALRRFAGAATRHAGARRDIFEAAAKILQDDVTLDDAVYEALAALVRG